MPRPGFNKFSIKLVVTSTCSQKSVLWQEFFPALAKVKSPGVMDRSLVVEVIAEPAAGELPTNVR